MTVWKLTENIKITVITLSKTARTLLRISGIPLSASVIASGHSGIAGQAMAVILRGSTYRGNCYLTIFTNRNAEFKTMNSNQQGRK